MKHILVCREYPPAPYPPGGIGTYAAQISKLLAQAGEEVHVIAQRWEGARASVEELHDGRLVIHRVATDEPEQGTNDSALDRQILRSLGSSDCPSHSFSWQVSRIVERLIQTEGIDLIEAPEWEAPLYFFQLRRNLGIEVRQSAPCLIHLHSPSEFIFRHNDWDVSLTDYEPLRRSEQFTVACADAIVCPSRYLAHQAESLFGLAPGQVEVIPYPLGTGIQASREPHVWRSNVICFLGRLELRKGILDWVDAAVSVARQEPSAVFEFVGSDTSMNGGPGSSVLHHVRRQIPSELRGRFHFRGAIERGRLGEMLSSVAAVVVPSRWENLPYTCIEAMSAGIPVLVSPEGGMAELITDGQSGWVAPDATSGGLAEALRRFLRTPANDRSRMGAAAQAAVRSVCANQTVLEKHLELRRRVAGRKEIRSFSLPGPAPRQPEDALAKDIAVVVTGDGQDILGRCLVYIHRQSKPAGFVAVERNQSRSGLKEAPLQMAALLDGVRQAVENCPTAECVVFVQRSVSLDPRALHVLETALATQPQAGIVAAMVRSTDGRVGVEIPEVLRTSWSLEDLRNLPLAAVRTRLLISEAALAGAAAVLYPEPLGTSAGTGSAAVTAVKKRYSAMALAQCASASLSLSWFAAAPLSLKLEMVGRILSRPARLANWLAWQFRSVARAR